MADLNKIVDDLCAEGAALDALVADLPTRSWAWPRRRRVGPSHTRSASRLDRPGRAAGGHRPRTLHRPARRGVENPYGFVDEGAEAERSVPPELLADWRECRARLAQILRDVPPGTKLPWYGPPMSAASMATARLMETWAHGRDVAAALGVAAESTDRLEHIARLGSYAGFAYSVNEITPPTEEFRVELVAPDGGTWAWGPDDAPQRVTGPPRTSVCSSRSGCTAGTRTAGHGRRRPPLARHRPGLRRTARRGP